MLHSRLIFKHLLDLLKSALNL
uniref:Uncharacterized protein n=1 Tax=Anguilla anguilla TaxID=7936 RepID=A0A0E9R254_ANGAN